MPTYIFTFKVKRRSKPNPNYNGILRTHRFYVDYYSLLNGQNPVRLMEDGLEPKISFPIRFVESIIDFAKELGGEVKKVRKVVIAQYAVSYNKPLVTLPSEIAFRRHLLFALVASTYRSPSRLNTLKGLVLDLNANFLNLLTNVALERYAELKSTSNTSWVWHVLRVGRAVKVLYNVG